MKAAPSRAIMTAVTLGQCRSADNRTPPVVWRHRHRKTCHSLTSTAIASSRADRYPVTPTDDRTRDTDYRLRRLAF
jgi:hypothetical protein